MTIKEAELNIRGFDAGTSLWDLNKRVIVAILRNYDKDCSDLTDEDKVALSEEIKSTIHLSIDHYLANDFEKDLDRSITWWFNNFHTTYRPEYSVDDLKEFFKKREKTKQRVLPKGGIELDDLIKERFPKDQN